MPTSRHGKVKHLLEDGRAKVVRQCPFTIRLLYDSKTYTQDLTLGVDTGSGTIGCAVSTDNGQVVYMSKTVVRNDITDRMTQRRMYRRNRRARKTRYRKPRFLNRGNSTREDRFSPTMVSKLHSHVKEIESIRSILPVKKVVLETGQFDTHLMKNPALADPEVRPWGYQKGPNYGFEDTRARVLDRDRHTCQCCYGRRRDPKLEVHHIIFHSNGGSDEAENLVTLCHACHKDLHAGKIHPSFGGKYKGPLKHAAQMNSIRCQLLKAYPDAVETTGAVTKANRLMLGMEKDHHLDACVIATGGKPVIFATDTVFLKRSIAEGDRQMAKGSHGEVPVPTGKVCGFRKFDKVRYLGREYFIKGRMSTGYAVLMDTNGQKADFSSMPRGRKTPKLCNCTRVSARRSVLVSMATV
jgi:5-methylcytosine-specific restriction endonuclease McrA